MKRIAESGETGFISGNNASITNAAESVHVSFSKNYENPVVVGHIATDNGGEPIDTRATNVTSSGFDFFVHEPDNEGHANNNHTYLACEQGAWETDEGHTIEAGIHQTETTTRANEDFAGDYVSFGHDWDSVPIVVANVNTHNNQTFSTVAIQNVTTDGFEVSQLAYNWQPTEIEEIGWIALPAVTGTLDGEQFEAATTTSTSVSWSSSFPDAPDYIADWNSYTGQDPRWVRGGGTWSSTDANWYLESGSNTGTYGYFALESNATINATPAKGDDEGSLFYQSNPESFEDGIGSDWSTVNTLTTATDRVFSGSAAGRNDTSPNDLIATYEPPSIEGGSKIESFEIFYQETSNQTGHSFNLIDSAGDIILSFGSENPQFWIRDGNGEKYQPGETNSIDTYDVWLRCSVKFDWTTGEYSFEFGRGNTEHYETITGSLKKSTDIAQVDIAGNYPNTNRGGSADDLWIDNLSVNNTTAARQGYSTTSDSTGGTYSGPFDHNQSAEEHPDAETATLTTQTSAAGTDASAGSVSESAGLSLTASVGSITTVNANPTDVGSSAFAAETTSASAMVDISDGALGAPLRSSESTSASAIGSTTSAESATQNNSNAKATATSDKEAVSATTISVTPEIQSSSGGIASATAITKDSLSTAEGINGTISVATATSLQSNTQTTSLSTSARSTSSGSALVGAGTTSVAVIGSGFTSASGTIGTASTITDSVAEKTETSGLKTVLDASYFFDTSGIYGNNGHPQNQEEFDRFFDHTESGVTFGGANPAEDRIHWGSGGSEPKLSYLPGDGFSWMWVGEIYAPSTGTYTFGIDGDDAVDFFIDGEKVVGWYDGHGSADNYGHNAQIDLTTGWHRATFRMEEGGGAEGASLGWQKPSDSSIATVPASNLRSGSIDTTADAFGTITQTKATEIGSTGTATLTASAQRDLASVSTGVADSVSATTSGSVSECSFDSQSATAQTLSAGSGIELAELDVASAVGGTESESTNNVTTSAATAEIGSGKVDTSGSSTKASASGLPNPSFVATTTVSTSTTVSTETASNVSGADTATAGNGSVAAGTESLGGAGDTSTSSFGIESADATPNYVSGIISTDSVGSKPTATAIYIFGSEITTVTAPATRTAAMTAAREASASLTASPEPSEGFGSASTGMAATTATGSGIEGVKGTIISPESSGASVGLVTSGSIYAVATTPGTYSETSSVGEKVTSEATVFGESVAQVISSESSTLASVTTSPSVEFSEARSSGVTSATCTPTLASGQATAATPGDRAATSTNIVGSAVAQSAGGSVVASSGTVAASTGETTTTTSGTVTASASVSEGPAQAVTAGGSVQATSATASGATVASESGASGVTPASASAIGAGDASADGGSITATEVAATDRLSTSLTTAGYATESESIPRIADGVSISDSSSEQAISSASTFGSADSTTESGSVTLTEGGINESRSEVVVSVASETVSFSPHSIDGMASVTDSEIVETDIASLNANSSAALSSVTQAGPTAEVSVSGSVVEATATPGVLNPQASFEETAAVLLVSASGIGLRETALANGIEGGGDTEVVGDARISETTSVGFTSSTSIVIVASEDSALVVSQAASGQTATTSTAEAQKAYPIGLGRVEPFAGTTTAEVQAAAEMSAVEASTNTATSGSGSTATSVSPTVSFIVPRSAPFKFDLTESEARKKSGGSSVEIASGKSSVSVQSTSTDVSVSSTEGP